MRLIDADELINDRVENDPVRIAAMCAPTAYDVNKVKRELHSPNNYTIMAGKHYTTVERAVEIVHSGGVAPEKPQSKDGKYMHDREEFFGEG